MVSGTPRIAAAILSSSCRCWTRDIRRNRAHTCEPRIFDLVPEPVGLVIHSVAAIGAESHHFVTVLVVHRTCSLELFYIDAADRRCQSLAGRLAGACWSGQEWRPWPPRAPPSAPRGAFRPPPRSARGGPWPFPPRPFLGRAAVRGAKFPSPP